jgi:hypothetical protein
VSESGRIVRPLLNSKLIAVDQNPQQFAAQGARFGMIDQTVAIAATFGKKSDIFKG